MSARTWHRLAIVALVALVGAGCTTLTEISTPDGPNTAGVSARRGLAGGSVSGDGRFTVFVGPRSASDPTHEVYRRDEKYGVTVLVSSDATGAPIGGDDAAISRTGRYVAFTTTAALVPQDTNLDPAQGRTGKDIYVRDMATPGSFDLVSIGDRGDQFASTASNFVDRPFISADGRYVAFRYLDICPGQPPCPLSYIRDRAGAQTYGLGRGSIAGITGDGRYAGIDYDGNCLVPCPSDGGVVKDWRAGTQTDVGCGSYGPMVMSDDGRYVTTWQTGHDPGCIAGVARWDRTRFAPPQMATPAAAFPDTPLRGLVGSGDSDVVAFDTPLALDAADTNGLSDVYVYDFETGIRQVASRTVGDAPANGPSYVDGVSADRTMVGFTTDATNLAPDDRDGKTDSILTPAFRPVVHADPSPMSIARGRTGTVHIVGAPLGTRAVVFGPAPGTFVVGGGPGVTTSNVVRSGDSNALDVDVSVASDAHTGSRDLLVSYVLPYGIASGVCHGCVRVT